MLKGGTAAWGEVPMPAHPQHPPDNLAAMVQYILDLRPPENGETVAGLRGELTTRKASNKTTGGGTYLFTASYRDQGASGVPPLTTEARCVLHARHTRAALFDSAERATVMEVATLKRSRRICVQLGVGSHLVFKDMNLAGIARAVCEAEPGVVERGTGRRAAREAKKTARWSRRNNSFDVHNPRKPFSTLSTFKSMPLCCTAVMNILNPMCIEFGFWLRSADGERESGAEGGEERLANRSRSATPAAEPQTEARRSAALHHASS